MDKSKQIFNFLVFYFAALSYQKQNKKVNKNVEKKRKNVDNFKKGFISVKSREKSIDN